VFQLASCVRNRMVKPQHAANIIHECAALLDLRLFRPPNKPSVILGGIQNDCTTEDLQLCLNKFGEIDEVSVDGKGNGKLPNNLIEMLSSFIRKLHFII